MNNLVSTYIVLIYNFFFLLAFSIPVIGQELPLYFNHLSSEQGLSSSQYNYFIYQDRIGKIWISSITGLNEFDGGRVIVHSADRNHSAALISPRAAFSDIYETSVGALWFTNVAAIIKYDTKRKQFNRQFILNNQQDTIRPEYRWMYLDTISGTSFIYADDGIYTQNLFEPKGARKILSVNFNYNTIVRKYNPSNYEFIHHRTNSNFINFYRYHVLSKTAQLERTEYTPDKSLVNNTFLLYPDELLVASKESLWLYSIKKKGKWHPINTSFAGKKVVDIVDMELIDHKRLLLATRSDGMYIYDLIRDSVTSKIFNYRYGELEPFQEHITRTYLDRQDNIWVSTASNGVWYTNLKKVKLLPIFFQHKSRISQIISIAEGYQGNIYALTPTQLIRISNQEKFKFELQLEGDGLERPTFVYEDSKENIWIGSLTKLLIKRPGRPNFESIDISPAKTGVAMGFNSVYETDKGGLIFATNQKSSILYRESQSSWVTPEVSRPFFAKPIGNYLFSATHKRELFIHRTDHLYEFADTILNLSSIATDIISTSDPSLYYISTFDGLYRLNYEEDAWHLEKDMYFPHLAVNSIHLDNDGYLWLASSRGLHRYHPARQTTWTFHEADGVQGPNFNFKSVLSHSDGRLFLGGTNGLNVFRPEEIEPTVPLPTAAITNILVNGQEEIDEYNKSTYPNSLFVTDLHLPFKDNNLTFHLSSLEYSDPLACRFRYRLLGSTRDTNWVDHGNNSVLDFPSLSAGRFALEIKASNSDGVWSAAKQVNIQVDPPWYRSNWFLSLAGIALLLIGFLIARRENKREREKEELRRKEAEEREQKEAAKRLAAEIETAVLRLQMDPHFIYNALNGVDDMIRQEKNKEASNYLYRISDLLRRILEQSEELNTTLTEEIELLELYISAEQIRLGDRLRYQFIVEEEVDKDLEEIPTMILQPFVENAIWHGIAPKEGLGLVTVHFSFSNAMLIVEITDDGVGRSRAPRHLKKKYESKAINITQRRLDLIKEYAGPNKAGFEIVDLFDEKRWPIGTKVIFQLPR